MNRIDLLRGPLAISWQMTRDCDLACLHCCTSSAPGRKLPDEMDRDEAMTFADDIVRADIPYVMLCGGEPAIVPHFLDVAERLGAAGVYLKIETNGQKLTADTVARLSRLPIRSIQISLDGDTEAVYRRQRPNGSLWRAHAACKLVRDAGMNLEITYAPSRLNIHEAEQVMARAETLGAFRFNTGALMPIGRAVQQWHRISLSQEETAEYRKLLDRANARVDRSMQLCYEPFSVQEGLMQCLDAPPGTLLVLPNGLVRLTGAMDHICGDVRCMDLARIWEKYCEAWRDREIVVSIRQAIDRFSSEAGRSASARIFKGVVENA
jgi:MoaA/NifB/PqqE/SkfB family radical SAM enzyme